MQRTHGFAIAIAGLSLATVAGASAIPGSATAQKRGHRRVTRTAPVARESGENYREDRNGGQRQINFSRVVNLSHVIEAGTSDMTQAEPNGSGMPIWPGDPDMSFTTEANIDPDGYFLRSFSMGEHSATNMNSYNSFQESTDSIDDYTADKLVVPVVVINVTAQAAANADYQLTVDDVRAWERRNGRIQKGAVVLLYTGWQDLWSTNPKKFIGADADGNLHFPGFAPDTTTWLLSNRRIGGAGIDTHGVDPGADLNYSTNNAVLAKHGIVLENLTNLDKLPVRGATIVIGALHLKDGSGAPAEVLAFV